MVYLGGEITDAILRDGGIPSQGYTITAVQFFLGNFFFLEKKKYKNK